MPIHILSSKVVQFIICWSTSAWKQRRRCRRKAMAGKARTRFAKVSYYLILPDNLKCTLIKRIGVGLGGIIDADGGLKLDWVSRLNKTLDHIEDNLTGTIDINLLARIAGCSSQQYARMFPFLTGVSLSEYIRRRKLTMAAFELQDKRKTVMEIALYYGYDSPTAFNAAFKKMHGVSPSQARAKGVLLESYPKLSFSLQIKGAVKMKYRLEEKEDFYVAGIKGKIQYANNTDNCMIRDLWDRFAEDDKERLLNHSNHLLHGLIGVSANSTEDEFDYYIAVTVDRDTPLAKETELLHIPDSAWAVFEPAGKRPEDTIDTWKRIFTEWLPNSGYQSGNTPCLEVYNQEGSESGYVFEIWVPLVKR